MPKTCPTCGAKVKRGFALTVPAAGTPRRVLQLSERAEAALLIPAGQAIGTGLVLAAIGTVAADLWLEVEPWKFGALCGGIALGGVWWDGIKDDAKREWYRLKTERGIDPATTAKPESKLASRVKEWFRPPAAMVGSKPPGRLKMAYQFYDIPFTDYDEAREVARAYLGKNVPFTRRDLIDCGALPDDPEHHSAIFNAMMEAGLLLKKGNGGIPNDKGREYLAACLAPPPRV